MMNNRKFIIPLATFVILGGFLSFVFLATTGSTMNALLIGYFYSLSFVVTLVVVQKTVINKLDVFRPAAQWTLRSFVYMVSICAAYLAGLLFHTTVLRPEVNISEFIGDTFWSSFVSFMSSPLDLEFFNSIFTDEYRITLIPFFAVIILISLVSLVGSYVEMRWQHNKQQLAVDKAELTALKAQIEPHFLFNSLNTIASEIKNDADNAEELILKLSDILRYLFDNSAKELISIDEELSFLEKYGDLIQARFGDTIQFKWQNTLPDGNREIPALLLQPLIENSIRHGRKGTADVLKITIDLSENDQGLLLVVSDNGRGIEPNKLKKLPANGHALANIVERLNLHYKRNNLLTIESEYGKNTKVSLLMPVRK
jgi:hypothetical protein